MCFSLDILELCSAAIHLCQFENACTDDLKARKHQEGLRLASSGGSHTWLRQDDMTGAVKTAKNPNESSIQQH